MQQRSISKESKARRTHQEVVGSVHEDVEGDPDDQVDPEGETAGAFFLTASPVFKINPVVRRVKVKVELKHEIGARMSERRWIIVSKEGIL